MDHPVVHELRQQLGEVASLASADGSWVRLNDKGGEGSFQPASDFSACDLSKPQAVGQATRCDQLWGFGEPNDYEDGEDCVFVDPRSTYNNLNDQGCEKLHHWVCVGTPPQDDPQRDDDDPWSQRDGADPWSQRLPLAAGS